MYDIIVIGGGASGLTAAISAKRNNPSFSVAILEKNSRVGKKLLTTGNGRCNISNVNIDISRFHSNNINFVKDVIDNSSVDVEEFFSTLGIPFVSEGDKLFPASLQASSVLDALRFECERLGVEIICDCNVTDIKSGFVVETTTDVYKARRVVLACGGNASPASGSNGYGLKMLARMGLPVTVTRPTIVPIKTQFDAVRPLKGVKVEGLLTLFDGKNSVAQKGEILFTDYGMSGPAVMQISRFVNSTDRQVYASVDFLPDLSIEQIVDYLMRRKEVAYGYVAENLMLGFLNKRVGLAIIKYCGLNSNDDCRKYSLKQIERIAAAIKDYSVKIFATCSFEQAQATAGGLLLDSLNPKTFEVKSKKGLFVCGEVLDCDGDCGGFNLHWAWVSGMIAGKSAAGV